MSKQALAIVSVILFSLVTHSLSRSLHVINFRSTDLYPESFTWDPKSDHFIAASLRHRQLFSVTDAGVVSTLLADSSLPPNTSFLGLSIDPRRHVRRIVAVVRLPDPPVSAVAVYDLNTHERLSLSSLPAEARSNDVAVDYEGNAYVTDSANNVVYKVAENGKVAVLSESRLLKSDKVEPTLFGKDCGLNGIVYNPKGYLLIIQSDTGKLFRVDAEDGTTRRVLLNKDLPAADGIALRSHDVLLVVSAHKLHFLKSDDSWSEGVVFDETALEEERQARDVAVGAEDRVYVLYGHVDEGMTGNSHRDEFTIVEVVSEKESKDENVWLYVLVGFGLAYFLFWRFQMKQLVQNMSKKTA